MHNRSIGQDQFQPRATTQVYTVPNFYWILAVEAFVFVFSAGEAERPGQALWELWETRSRALSAESFPRRGENVENLSFGFPHFHGAGSFHRALHPNAELISFLASNPRCRAGARRHKEIFGHQRGGPILEERRRR